MTNLTDQEFMLFKNFVYDKAGILLSDAKKNLVHNRLHKRLRTLRLKSFKDYYDWIIRDSDELRNFLDVITTHETSFFRDARLFDTLALKILPEIVERKREGKIRIWSSACSTGEEPYSIAITALEAIPQIDRTDIAIYASDISLGSLEKAKEGKYTADKLMNIKEEVLSKYFSVAPFKPSVKDDDSTGKEYFQINSRVKGLVKFVQHNLKEPFEYENIDIIFCRNVLIYFDKDSKQKVINELNRRLINGGYLFLGGAESLQDMQTKYKYIAPSLYKKL
jgi:chemotaxis protein methyltransferase CheR